MMSQTCEGPRSATERGAKGGLRRLGLCLALAMGVAGCQGGGGLSLLSAPEPVPVLGGALRIAGPAHYCPDPASLRETERSAAILLGRCSSDSAAPPAVLTVSVGAPGSAGVLAEGGAALAAFLTTEAGRASISRSGRARDVKIGTALMAKGVFLVRIEDRMQGIYWRGMVPVAGYLVSVSALGPDLPPEEGRNLVEAAARALQRANRG